METVFPPKSDHTGHPHAKEQHFKGTLNHEVRHRLFFAIPSILDFLYIFILVLLTTLFSVHWLFGQPEILDNFGYRAYMLDPGHMLSAFPKTPIGDLVPVYFPVFCLTQILGSVFGLIFYKILILISTLFFIYKSINVLTSNSLLAFVGAFLCLSNPYFLPLMGSEYAQGFAVFYFSGTIFFLINSSSNDFAKHRHLQLIFAGLFISMMIWTAFLTISYIPALTFIYLFFNYSRQKKFSFFDLLVPLGFLLETLLISLVYYKYTGTPFFFKATFAKIFNYLGSQRTPDRPTAHWLLGSGG